MSELTTPENSDQNPNQPITPGEDPGDIKGIRAELAKVAAEKEALSIQLAENQRSQAISAAGLELNDVQKAALEATHKGEWTAEALAETATSLGFQAKAEEPVVNAAEAASLSRAASLGAGAEQPNLTQEIENKMESWASAGKQGMNEDQFYAEVANTLGTDFFSEHQRKLQSSP